MDAFGLFGSKKIHFGTNEIFGIVIIITGIIVFQCKR
ncbi:MAG: DMT family transporter [Clostridiaceae bacterium]